MMKIRSWIPRIKYDVHIMRYLWLLYLLFFYLLSSGAIFSVELSASSGAEEAFRNGCNDVEIIIRYALIYSKLARLMSKYV